MAHILVSLEDIKAIVKSSIKEELSAISNNPPAHLDDEILSLIDAAKFLKLSVHTVKKLAMKGKIPRALPDVRGLRFRFGDLKQFSSAYRQQ